MITTKYQSIERLVEETIARGVLVRTRVFWGRGPLGDNPESGLYLMNKDKDLIVVPETIPNYKWENGNHLGVHPIPAYATSWCCYGEPGEQFGRLAPFLDLHGKSVYLIGLSIPEGKTPLNELLFRNLGNDFRHHLKDTSDIEGDNCLGPRTYAINSALENGAKDVTLWSKSRSYNEERIRLTLKEIRRAK